MKEWFVQNFDAAAITGIIVAITSLVSAIAGVVVAIKQTHNSNKFLEDAKKEALGRSAPIVTRLLDLPNSIGDSVTVSPMIILMACLILKSGSKFP